MALVANPYALAGVLVGLLAWSFAGFVYFARPDRAQNRRLAVLLVFEGLLAFAGNGAIFATDNVASAVAWQALATMSLLVLLPVYLRFIATLETPLVRPLRWRAVDATLVVLAVLLPFTWMLSRETYLAGMYSPWFAPWEQLAGPGFLAILYADAIAYVFGAAAALHAYVRAPRGSAVRRRAGFFLAGFGIRDVLFAAMVAITAFVPMFHPAGPVGALMYANGPACIALLYLPVLAYGILRSQLFDIDLKIKRGLRRGTLAAVFVAVFFAASEGAAALVESRTGSALVGILAAALLVLGLAPLQRLADRVADAAMPRVEASPDYLVYRKFEVYKAALAGALEEGGIDVQERAVLRRLREKLGLREEDALAMERELLGVAAERA